MKFIKESIITKVISQVLLVCFCVSFVFYDYSYGANYAKKSFVSWNSIKPDEKYLKLGSASFMSMNTSIRSLHSKAKGIYNVKANSVITNSVSNEEQIIKTIKESKNGIAQTTLTNIEEIGDQLDTDKARFEQKYNEGIGLFQSRVNEKIKSIRNIIKKHEKMLQEIKKKGPEKKGPINNALKDVNNMVGALEYMTDGANTTANKLFDLFGFSQKWKKTLSTPLDALGNELGKIKEKTNSVEQAYNNGVDQEDVVQMIRNRLDPIMGMMVRLAKWKEDRMGDLAKRFEDGNKRLESLTESRQEQLTEDEEDYFRMYDSQEEEQLMAQEKNTNESLTALEAQANQELQAGLAPIYAQADEKLRRSAIRDFGVSGIGAGTDVLYTDDSEGGYIGDTQDYEGIEQMQRTQEGNVLVDQAIRESKTGALDSVKRAEELGAAAGLTGKNLSVVLPRDMSDTSLKGKEVEVGEDVGELDGQVKEAPGFDDLLDKYKNELDNMADSMISRENSFIDNLLNNYRSKASEGMQAINAAGARARKEIQELTDAQMQDIMNFIDELLIYMDKVWPEAQVGEGGVEDKNADAIDALRTRYNELKGKISGKIWLGVVMLGVAVVGGIFAIIELVQAIIAFTPKVTDGVAAPLSVAEKIWGVLKLIGAVAGLISAVAGFAVGIWKFVAALSDLGTLAFMYQELQAEIGEVEDQMIDPTYDTDGNQIDTTYTNFLLAEQDYNDAKNGFEDEFNRLFKTKKRKTGKDWVRRLTIYTDANGNKRKGEIMILWDKKLKGTITPEELKYLRKLLFKFKNASESNQLRSAMNTLDDAENKYNSAMQAMKDDPTMITLGDGTQVSMYEAYEYLQDLKLQASILAKILYPRSDGFIGDLTAEGKDLFQQITGKEFKWNAANGAYWWDRNVTKGLEVGFYGYQMPDGTMVGGIMGGWNATGLYDKDADGNYINSGGGWNALRSFLSLPVDALYAIVMTPMSMGGMAASMMQNAATKGIGKAAGGVIEGLVGMITTPIENLLGMKEGSIFHCLFGDGSIIDLFSNKGTTETKLVYKNGRLVGVEEDSEIWGTGENAFKYWKPGQAIGNLVENFFLSGIGGIDSLINMGKNVGKFFKNVGTVLKNMVTGVKNLVAVIKEFGIGAVFAQVARSASMAWDAIGEATEGGFKAFMKKAGGALLASFKAHPRFWTFGLRIGLVGAGVGIVALVDHLTGGKIGINKLFREKALNMVGYMVGGTIAGWEIGKRIVKFLKNFGGSFKKNLNKVQTKKGLFSGTNGVGKSMKTFFGQIGTRFKQSRLGRALATAGTWINQKVLRPIRNRLSGVGKVFKVAGQFLNEKVFKPVGEWFKGAGQKIGNALKPVGEWFKGAGQKIGNALKPVGEWFKGAGETIRNSKAGVWFKEAGQNIRKWVDDKMFDLKFAIDYDILRPIRESKAGQWFKKAGQDAGAWFKKAGQDAGAWFKKTFSKQNIEAFLMTTIFAPLVKRKEEIESESIAKGSKTSQRKIDKRQAKLDGLDDELSNLNDVTDAVKIDEIKLEKVRLQAEIDFWSNRDFAQHKLGKHYVREIAKGAVVVSAVAVGAVVGGVVFSQVEERGLKFADLFKGALIGGFAGVAIVQTIDGIKTSYNTAKAYKANKAELIAETKIARKQFKDAYDELTGKQKLQFHLDSIYNRDGSIFSDLIAKQEVFDKLRTQNLGMISSIISSPFQALSDFQTKMRVAGGLMVLAEGLGITEFLFGDEFKGTGDKTWIEKAYSNIGAFIGVKAFQRLQQIIVRDMTRKDLEEEALKSREDYEVKRDFYRDYLRDEGLTFRTGEVTIDGIVRSKGGEPDVLRKITFDYMERGVKLADTDDTFMTRSEFMDSVFRRHIPQEGITIETDPRGKRSTKIMLTADDIAFMKKAYISGLPDSVIRSKMGDFDDLAEVRALSKAAENREIRRILDSGTFDADQESRMLDDIDDFYRSDIEELRRIEHDISEREGVKLTNENRADITRELEGLRTQREQAREALADYRSIQVAAIQARGGYGYTQEQLNDMNITEIRKLKAREVGSDFNEYATREFFSRMPEENAMGLVTDLGKIMDGSDLPDGFYEYVKRKKELQASEQAGDMDLWDVEAELAGFRNKDAIEQELSDLRSRGISVDITEDVLRDAEQSVRNKDFYNYAQKRRELFIKKEKNELTDDQYRDRIEKLEAENPGMSRFELNADVNLEQRLFQHEQQEQQEGDIASRQSFNDLIGSEYDNSLEVEEVLRKNVASDLMYRYAEAKSDLRAQLERNELDLAEYKRQIDVLEENNLSIRRLERDLGVDVAERLSRIKRENVGADANVFKEQFGTSLEESLAQKEASVLTRMSRQDILSSGLIQWHERFRELKEENEEREEELEKAELRIREMDDQSEELVDTLAGKLEEKIRSIDEGADPDSVGNDVIKRLLRRKIEALNDQGINADIEILRARYGEAEVNAAINKFRQTKQQLQTDRQTAETTLENANRIIAKNSEAMKTKVRFTIAGNTYILSMDNTARRDQLEILAKNRGDIGSESRSYLTQRITELEVRRRNLEDPSQRKNIERELEERRSELELSDAIYDVEGVSSGFREEVTDTTEQTRDRRQEALQKRYHLEQEIQNLDQEIKKLDEKIDRLETEGGLLDQIAVGKMKKTREKLRVKYNEAVGKFELENENFRRDLNQDFTDEVGLVNQAARDSLEDSLYAGFNKAKLKDLFEEINHLRGKLDTARSGRRKKMLIKSIEGLQSEARRFKELVDDAESRRIDPVEYRLMSRTEIKLARMNDGDILGAQNTRLRSLSRHAQIDLDAVTSVRRVLSKFKAKFMLRYKRIAKEKAKQTARKQRELRKRDGLKRVLNAIERDHKGYTVLEEDYLIGDGLVDRATRKAIDDYLEKTSEQETKKGELEDELTQLKQEFEELKTGNEGIRSNLDSLEDRIAVKQTEINEVKRKLNSLEIEQESHLRRISQFEDEIRRLRNQYEENREAFESILEDKRRGLTDEEIDALRAEYDRTTVVAEIIRSGGEYEERLAELGEDPMAELRVLRLMELARRLPHMGMLHSYLINEMEARLERGLDENEARAVREIEEYNRLTEIIMSGDDTRIAAEVGEMDKVLIDLELEKRERGLSDEEVRKRAEYHREYSRKTFEEVLEARGGRKRVTDAEIALIKEVQDADLEKLQQKIREKQAQLDQERDPGIAEGFARRRQAFEDSKVELEGDISLLNEEYGRLDNTLEIRLLEDKIAERQTALDEVNGRLKNLTAEDFKDVCQSYYQELHDIEDARFRQLSQNKNQNDAEIKRLTRILESDDETQILDGFDTGDVLDDYTLDQRKDMIRDSIENLKQKSKNFELSIMRTKGRREVYVDELEEVLDINSGITNRRKGTHGFKNIQKTAKWWAWKDEGGGWKPGATIASKIILSVFGIIPLVNLAVVGIGDSVWYGVDSAYNSATGRRSNATDFDIGRRIIKDVDGISYTRMKQAYYLEGRALNLIDPNSKVYDLSSMQRVARQIHDTSWLTEVDNVRIHREERTKKLDNLFEDRKYGDSVERLAKDRLNDTVDESLSEAGGLGDFLDSESITVIMNIDEVSKRLEEERDTLQKHETRGEELRTTKAAYEAELARLEEESQSLERQLYHNLVGEIEAKQRLGVIEIESEYITKLIEMQEVNQRLYNEADELRKKLKALDLDLNLKRRRLEGMTDQESDAYKVLRQAIIGDERLLEELNQNIRSKETEFEHENSLAFYKLEVRRMSRGLEFEDAKISVLPDDDPLREELISRKNKLELELLHMLNNKSRLELEEDRLELESLKKQQREDIRDQEVVEFLGRRIMEVESEIMDFDEQIIDREQRIYELYEGLRQSFDPEVLQSKAKVTDDLMLKTEQLETALEEARQRGVINIEDLEEEYDDAMLELEIARADYYRAVRMNIMYEIQDAVNEGRIPSEAVTDSFEQVNKTIEEVNAKIWLRNLDFVPEARLAELEEIKTRMESEVNREFSDLRESDVAFSNRIEEVDRFLRETRQKIDESDQSLTEWQVRKDGLDRQIGETESTLQRSEDTLGLPTKNRRVLRYESEQNRVSTELRKKNDALSKIDVARTKAKKKYDDNKRKLEEKIRDLQRQVDEKRREQEVSSRAVSRKLGHKIAVLGGKLAAIEETLRKNKRAWRSKEQDWETKKQTINVEIVKLNRELDNTRRAMLDELQELKIRLALDPEMEEQIRLKREHLRGFVDALRADGSEGLNKRAMEDKKEADDYDDSETKIGFGDVISFAWIGKVHKLRVSHTHKSNKLKQFIANRKVEYIRALRDYETNPNSKNRKKVASHARALRRLMREYVKLDGSVGYRDLAESYVFDIEMSRKTEESLRAVYKDVEDVRARSFWKNLSESGGVKTRVKTKKLKGTNYNNFNTELREVLESLPEERRQEIEEELDRIPDDDETAKANILSRIIDEVETVRNASIEILLGQNDFDAYSVLKRKENILTDDELMQLHTFERRIEPEFSDVFLAKQLIEQEVLRYKELIQNEKMDNLRQGELDELEGLETRLRQAVVDESLDIPTRVTLVEIVRREQNGKTLGRDIVDYDAALRSLSQSKILGDDYNKFVELREKTELEDAETELLASFNKRIEDDAGETLKRINGRIELGNLSTRHEYLQTQLVAYRERKRVGEALDDAEEVHSRHLESLNTTLNLRFKELKERVIAENETISKAVGDLLNEVQVEERITLEDGETKRVVGRKFNRHIESLNFEDLLKRSNTDPIDPDSKLVQMKEELTRINDQLEQQRVNQDEVTRLNEEKKALLSTYKQYLVDIFEFKVTDDITRRNEALENFKEAREIIVSLKPVDSSLTDMFSARKYNDTQAQHLRDCEQFVRSGEANTGGKGTDMNVDLAEYNGFFNDDLYEVSVRNDKELFGVLEVLHRPYIERWKQMLEVAGTGLGEENVIEAVEAHLNRIDTTNRPVYEKVQTFLFGEGIRGIDAVRIDILKVVMLKTMVGEYGDSLADSKNLITHGQMTGSWKGQKNRIIALPMGWGKTFMYKLISTGVLLHKRSKMLHELDRGERTEVEGNISELVVASVQEIDNTITETEGMLRLFTGSRIINGTEMFNRQGKQALIDEIEKAKREGYDLEVVFDADKRGSITNEMKRDPIFRKAMLQVGLRLLDEADAGLERKTSYLEADQRAATVRLKIESASIIEVYEYCRSLGYEFRHTQGSGIVMGQGLYDAMDEVLRTNERYADYFAHKQDLSGAIQNVLRGIHEVDQGEVLRGDKVTNINGVIQGQSDGVAINKICTEQYEIYRAWKRRTGSSERFSFELFKEITGQDIRDQDISVSETSIESATFEAYSRNPNIKGFFQCGGSGTTESFEASAATLYVRAARVREAQYSAYPVRAAITRKTTEDGQIVRQILDKSGAFPRWVSEQEYVGTFAGNLLRRNDEIRRQAGVDSGETFGGLVAMDHSEIRGCYRQTVKDLMLQEGINRGRVDGILEDVDGLVGSTHRVCEASRANPVYEGKHVNSIFMRHVSEVDNAYIRRKGLHAFESDEGRKVTVDLDWLIANRKILVESDASGTRIRKLTIIENRPDKGQSLEVSDTDLLRSNGIRTLWLGRNVDIDHSSLVTNIGKIGVVGNLSDNSLINSEAKTLASRGGIMLATYKTYRGINFKDKVYLLALGFNKLNTNQAKQFLGRSARGNNVFAGRIQVSDYDSLADGLIQTEDLLENQLTQLKSSLDTHVHNSQSRRHSESLGNVVKNLRKKIVKLQAELETVKFYKSELDDYRRIVESGEIDELRQINETRLDQIVRYGSEITSRYEQHATSMYLLSTAVGTILTKNPLEDLERTAVGRDKAVINAAIKNSRLRILGAADVIEALDGKYKTRDSIVFKMLNSQIDGAIAMYRQLIQRNFVGDLIDEFGRVLKPDQFEGRVHKGTLRNKAMIQRVRSMIRDLKTMKREVAKIKKQKGIDLAAEEVRAEIRQGRRIRSFAELNDSREYILSIGHEVLRTSMLLVDKVLPVRKKQKPARKTVLGTEFAYGKADIAYDLREVSDINPRILRTQPHTAVVHFEDDASIGTICTKVGLIPKVDPYINGKLVRTIVLTRKQWSDIQLNRIRVRGNSFSPWQKFRRGVLQGNLKVIVKGERSDYTDADVISFTGDTKTTQQQVGVGFWTGIERLVNPFAVTPISDRLFGRSKTEEGSTHERLRRSQNAVRLRALREEKTARSDMSEILEDQSDSTEQIQVQDFDELRESIRDYFDEITESLALDPDAVEAQREREYVRENKHIVIQVPKDMEFTPEEERELDSMLYQLRDSNVSIVQDEDVSITKLVDVENYKFNDEITTRSQLREALRNIEFVDASARESLISEIDESESSSLTQVGEKLSEEGVLNAADSGRVTTLLTGSTIRDDAMKTMYAELHTLNLEEEVSSQVLSEVADDSIDDDLRARLLTIAGDLDLSDRDILLHSGIIKPQDMKRVIKTTNSRVLREQHKLRRAEARRWRPARANYYRKSHHDKGWYNPTKLGGRYMDSGGDKTGLWYRFDRRRGRKINFGDIRGYSLDVRKYRSLKKRYERLEQQHKIQEMMQSPDASKTLRKLRDAKKKFEKARDRIKHNTTAICQEVYSANLGNRGVRDIIFQLPEVKFTDDEATLEEDKKEEVRLEVDSLIRGHIEEFVREISRGDIAVSKDDREFFRPNIAIKRGRNIIAGYNRSRGYRDDFGELRRLTEDSEVITIDAASTTQDEFDRKLASGARGDSPLLVKISGDDKTTLNRIKHVQRMSLKLGIKVVYEYEGRFFSSDRNAQSELEERWSVYEEKTSKFRKALGQILRIRQKRSQVEDEDEPEIFITAEMPEELFGTDVWDEELANRKIEEEVREEDVLEDPTDSELFEEAWDEERLLSHEILGEPKKDVVTLLNVSELARSDERKQWVFNMLTGLRHTNDRRDIEIVMNDSDMQTDEGRELLIFLNRFVVKANYFNQVEDNRAAVRPDYEQRYTRVILKNERGFVLNQTDVEKTVLIKEVAYNDPGLRYALRNGIVQMPVDVLDSVGLDIFFESLSNRINRSTVTREKLVISIDTENLTDEELQARLDLIDEKLKTSYIENITFISRGGKILASNDTEVLNRYETLGVKRLSKFERESFDTVEAEDRTDVMLQGLRFNDEAEHMLDNTLDSDYVKLKKLYKNINKKTEFVLTNLNRTRYRTIHNASVLVLEHVNERISRVREELETASPDNIDRIFRELDDIDNRLNRVLNEMLQIEDDEDNKKLLINLQQYLIAGSGGVKTPIRQLEFLSNIFTYDEDHVINIVLTPELARNSYLEVVDYILRRKAAGDNRKINIKVKDSVVWSSDVVDNVKEGIGFLSAEGAVIKTFGDKGRFGQIDISNLNVLGLGAAKTRELKKELIDRGYIDDRGYILESFRDVLDITQFELDEKFDSKKKEIYKILRDATRNYVYEFMNFRSMLRTRNLNGEDKIYKNNHLILKLWDLERLDLLRVLESVNELIMESRLGKVTILDHNDRIIATNHEASQSFMEKAREQNILSEAETPPLTKWQNFVLHANPKLRGKVKFSHVSLKESRVEPGSGYVLGGRQSVIDWQKRDANGNVELAELRKNTIMPRRAPQLSPAMQKARNMFIGSVDDNAHPIVKSVLFSETERQAISYRSIINQAEQTGVINKDHLIRGVTSLIGVVGSDIELFPIFMRGIREEMGSMPDEDMLNSILSLERAA